MKPRDCCATSPPARASRRPANASWPRTVARRTGYGTGSPRGLEVLARVLLQRDRLAHLRIDEAALVERNGQSEPDEGLARFAAGALADARVRGLRVEAAHEVERGEVTGPLALDLQRRDVE